MKRFYAGGIIYNSHSKKILLQKREEKDSNKPGVWSLLGGLSKGDETPEKTLQRELLEDLKVRVSLKEIVPLYDYFNEEFNTHRHVFVVLSKALSASFKLPEETEFSWIPLATIFKNSLSPKTRQDLTFFQREMAAKFRTAVPATNS